MTEEKKEEKQEVKADSQAKAPAAPVPPPPQEAAKTAAPQDAAATAAPQAAPAAAAPAAEKAPVKKEKPANCAGCNKSIKKKRWYYRNGKFYCTQRCWKTTAKKDAAVPAAPGAPEAAK